MMLKYNIAFNPLRHFFHFCTYHDVPIQETEMNNGYLVVINDNLKC